MRVMVNSFWSYMFIMEPISRVTLMHDFSFDLLDALTMDVVPSLVVSNFIRIGTAQTAHDSLT